MSFFLDEAKTIGEELGIDWETSLFPPEQFLAGLEVELEHGTAVDPRVNITDDDPLLTGKIALAHLLESPSYYTLLEAMEEGFEKHEARTADIQYIKRLLKDVEKFPFFPRYTSFGIALLPDGTEGIAIRTWEEKLNPRDLEQLRRLVKPVDIDYRHSPELPTIRDAATVEEQFGEAAEHINEALELLRDLEDLPGEHEDVIVDLIEDAENLMVALDEETIPEEKTAMKRFRQPRKRTAVIKPCKAKDYDPDRPKNEQKICLYTKDGKRLLGRHPTEESARKQEVAIKIHGGNAKHAALQWMVTYVGGTTPSDNFSIFGSTRQLIVTNHTNRTAAIFNTTVNDVKIVPYEKIVRAHKKKQAAKKLSSLIKEGYVPPMVTKDGVTYVPNLNDPETRRRWRTSQRRFSNLK